MKYTTFIILILVSVIVKGQIKAVTAKGDTVILQDNGNWKYQKIDSIELGSDSITLNNQKFHKSSLANFLKKSKNMNVGVYFDQLQWGCVNGATNGSAEYTFINKDKDLNATFITETTEVELSNMVDIVFMNAQKLTSDIEIVSKEYRIVNGLKVLCMKLKGGFNGIKGTFLYYIYSNETGVVQFVAFTTTKKFDANYKVLENLLNGLSLTKK